MSFVSSFGPQNIWEYTKEAFSFLTVVCSAVQKGDQPTYKFDIDGDASLQIGDKHLHYHGQVVQIGKLALPSYQNLEHLIDPKKLNQISANPISQETPYISRSKG